MERIIKRNSKAAVRERDLRLVTDYKAGYEINQILERNGVKSPQTIYNAIKRFNKLLEEREESDVERDN